jgi:HTH-type transcriptional regulator / antitoxin HigA
MELHPIKTETDYREALRAIELLFDAAPNTQECDRLDILSTLVEAYEKANFPIEIPDPIAAIQYYMDTRGWSRSDLEVCLGSQARVSEVLSRKRSLTLEIIRKLHQELGVPAEILIQPYQSVQTSARSCPCTLANS